MPVTQDTATVLRFPEPTGTVAVMTDDVIVELFEANRDKLLALIRRKLSPRLRKRIDPEDILQDAMLRASKRKEWLASALSPQQQARNLERIVSEQTIDRVRAELGPARNSDRDLHFPDESVAQLALGLLGVPVDAQQGVGAQGADRRGARGFRSARTNRPADPAPAERREAVIPRNRPAPRTRNG